MKKLLTLLLFVFIFACFSPAVQAAPLRHKHPRHHRHHNLHHHHHHHRHIV